MGNITGERINFLEKQYVSITKKKGTRKSPFGFKFLPCLSTFEYLTSITSLHWKSNCAMRNPSDPHVRLYALKSTITRLRCQECY